MKNLVMNLFHPHQYSDEYPNNKDLSLNLALVLNKSTTAKSEFLKLIECEEISKTSETLFYLDMKIENLKEITSTPKHLTVVNLEGSSYYYEMIRHHNIKPASQDYPLDLVMIDADQLIVIKIDKTQDFDVTQAIIKNLKTQIKSTKDVNLNWGKLHYQFSLIEDNVIINDYLENFNNSSANLLSTLSLKQIKTLPEGKVKFVELQKYFRNAILDYYEILLSSNSLASQSRRLIEYAVEDIYKLDLTKLLAINVLNSNLTYLDYFDDFELNYDKDNFYLDIMLGASPGKNNIYKEIDLKELFDCEKLTILDTEVTIQINPLLKLAGSKYDKVNYLSPENDYSFEDYKVSLDEILSLNRPQVSQSIFIDDNEKEEILRIYEELDTRKLIFNHQNLMELMEERLGHDLIFVNPSLHIRLTFSLEDVAKLEQSTGELILLTLKELFE